jgi:Spy/CpxP family protein refolding chaperone
MATGATRRLDTTQLEDIIMKHTTTTVIISAVLAGSLAAAVPAFARGMGPGGDCGQAGPGMMGRHGDPEARIDRMVRNLKLDTKQTEAVRAISDKHRAEMRALHDRSAENRKQLRALTAQGDVDAAKLRALADAQGKDMADMIVMRVRMQAEIGKVLTPAQREQMQKQRRDRGDRQDG